MKLTIQKDFFGNPHPPRIFLCTTGKKRIGQLPTYDESLNASWNKYGELNFSINRQYTDVITGETKIDPLFDKAEGLRKVYVEDIGYFTIQDPDTKYSDGDTKTISAFSSEYECASKYLESFRINTGDVDSAEVMYLEDIYGEDYTIDTDELYEPAPQGSDNFDPYEKYFIKEYTDTDSYTYERVAVADENDYVNYNGLDDMTTLYISKYPNVRFYWPGHKELSLLNLVFQKIPEWKIGNVDASLCNQERKFDEDRISVYDFLMNEVSDTFECIVEWDTINGVVNFYEEEENGITEENTIQEQFDTNIYITRENLANEININYSSDDIKTKLKVSGSDDLNIREVNLGNNYIMNLDFYHNSDWMEDDLWQAYDTYKTNIETYSPQYTEAVSGRVAAYNHWNDLMNNVPAEGNVVLIGDKFKKLYCSYTPISNAYYNGTISDAFATDHGTLTDLYSDESWSEESKINKSMLSNGKEFIVQGYAFAYQLNDNNFKCLRNIINGVGDQITRSNKNALIEKLSSYHVNEDVNGNKTDNILLRLKDNNSNTITFRLFAPPIEYTDLYNPSLKYYIKIGNSYSEISSSNKQSSFNSYRNNATTIYTTSEDYSIVFNISYAETGIISEDNTISFDNWINGNITDEYMESIDADLTGYKVSYIGTMGAYFVLAKDETKTASIEDYGIMLLKEKQETYTKIFQTQTEQMYSQEKYQCTVSDAAPTGIIPNGTRWLDTDENPIKLKVYSNGNWIEETVSDDDKYNYENYQRYIDNFKKLKAVQEVLTTKEKEAQYCLDGYAVSSMKVDINDYPAENNYRKNGTQSLGNTLMAAAVKHFSDINDNLIIQGECDNEASIQLFTIIGYDNINFAVYLKDKTPYVAYASSVGVYQAKMNYINQLTSFENAFTEDQWIRLSPLIREDEFSDDNFLLTGYESEEERISICKELMEAASKELKKLAQPSLEFSMNMGNILALPEFSSLTSQFKLGNFIRIELRPGLVKRSRLLSVDIDFNDLSNFSCQFGNLITTKDQIDLHAELMKQAIQAGKQVATSASDWQRAVDKSTKLEQAIANGLQEATLEVGKANGQSIEIGQYGIWGRKLVDGTTDTYEPEQFRITNNKLVFSNDAFETSKALFGKYEIDGDTRWGVLAENVTGGLIEGSQIRGGTLKIGDYNNENGTYFMVDEQGNVSIQRNGKTAYANASAVAAITEFSTELEYSGQTIFSDQSHSCIITCKVYHRDQDTGARTDITDAVVAQSDSIFNWQGYNGTVTANPKNVITINYQNVLQYSEITCQVQFDDSTWVTNN